jgi:hypothetical protein
VTPQPDVLEALARAFSAPASGSDGALVDVCASPLDSVRPLLLPFGDAVAARVPAEAPPSRGEPLPPAAAIPELGSPVLPRVPSEPSLS